MAQDPRDAQATGEGTPLVETRLDGTEVLVGVFAEREAVERAVNMLQAGGFDPATISIVAKDRATSERIAGQFADLQGGDNLTTEPEPERMEGQIEVDKVSEANPGVGVGLVAGAAAGAALGLATLALPGVGGILAAGPIAHALAGATAGAGAGAWAGSLAGVGIPNAEAAKYVEEMEEGRWIVALRTDRIDETLGIFHNAGALNV